MSHIIECDFCGDTFHELAGVWERKGKYACHSCAKEIEGER